jgi:hypothetical protein
MGLHGTAEEKCPRLEARCAKGGGFHGYLKKGNESGVVVRPSASQSKHKLLVLNHKVSVGCWERRLRPGLTQPMSSVERPLLAQAV